MSHGTERVVNLDNSTLLVSLLFKEGFLSSLIVVFFLPVYIFLLRPFTNTYKMRIFVRIGIGTVLLLLSVISTFTTDTIVHTRNITQACMLNNEEFLYAEILSEKLHPTVLLPQRILYGLSLMLIYPALYEFICAQNPHSMKGLFIGLLFAVRGRFELLASLLLIPFTFTRHALPSCGMEYYMLVIAVGVAGLAVYMYVARKYKLREEMNLVMCVALWKIITPRCQKNYDSLNLCAVYIKFLLLLFVYIYHS